MITINKDDNDQNNYSIDYNEVYPFRITDGDIIPTDRTGYIYCLISKQYHDEIYIGQTQCLSQQLINHNSGHGSYSTNSIQKRPWDVAACICGLSHLSRIDRLSIESRWKDLIEDLPDSTSKLKLMWTAIQLQNANHDGDPARVKPSVELYSKIRDDLMPHDRALTTFVDLNLAVHYNSMFDFKESYRIKFIDK